MKLCVALLLAHSWYPVECCSGGDCHPVPCSEIVEGWREGSLRWHKLIFLPSKIHDSQDDQCHVCGNEDGDSSSSAYCIFIPKGIS